MKRVLLFVLVLLAVGLAVVGYAAATKITDKAVMTYTDAETGEAYPVASAEGTVAVLSRPKAVAPSSVIRGVPAAITVTCDVGGPEWTYRVTLPTWGGTLVPGSLTITGGTGTLTGTTVQFGPLPEPGEVVVTYRVIW